MKSARRIRGTNALARSVEALAREHVNKWIESGLTTADMRDRSDEVTKNFSDFMHRDIRLFGATGKYPEWAGKEDVPFILDRHNERRYFS